MSITQYGESKLLQKLGLPRGGTVALRLKPACCAICYRDTLCPTYLKYKNGDSTCLMKLLRLARGSIEISNKENGHDIPTKVPFLNHKTKKKMDPMTFLNSFEDGR